MKSLLITIPGDPVPQPRPQARIAGHGRERFVHIYTPAVREKIGEEPNGDPIMGPDKLKAWRNAIARAATDRIVMTLSRVGRVHIKVYFARTQEMLHHSMPDGIVPCESQGDADNFAKPILDVFTEMQVWRDDRIVWSLLTEKFWVRRGKSPGARVEIDFYDADECLPAPALFAAAEETKA